MTDKEENPCLTCPVPKDIQNEVDCSTVCGAVFLGIDWQNQCKALVKDLKQVRKETAKEIISYLATLTEDGGTPFKGYIWFERLCKKYGVEVEE